MTKFPKRRNNSRYIIEREDFQTLMDALVESGYRLIGPTVRDGVVAYDEISSVSDFPVGIADEQEKGTYGLRKTNQSLLFNYSLGPQTWKKFLYPANVRLWQTHRMNGGFEIEQEVREAERLALIGVRACELHAMAIQDQIFMGGAYVDPAYRAQRENVFIVAVNCGRAGKTCFCASMDTGPRATSSFDLSLTEISEPGRHYFVVEAGSHAGENVVASLSLRFASDDEIKTAEKVIAETASQMGRSIDTSGLKELLYASYDHPQWDNVATRCLTCGNCTLVCPTCFCTTVEDVTDLTGDSAARWRKWDSCFTMDFSYIVGGSIRPSAKSRYRQWMTHKLATWIDQFGTSGCVGCGRCITWCPVGIDITEEAKAIREERKVNTDSGMGKKKQHENA
ncbi:MAG: 4Fe-4S dicluster domain-containing protein [Anaerolineae bacterium]